MPLGNGRSSRGGRGGDQIPRISDWLSSCGTWLPNSGDIPPDYLLHPSTVPVHGKPRKFVGDRLSVLRQNALPMRLTSSRGMRRGRPRQSHRHVWPPRDPAFGCVSRNSREAVQRGNMAPLVYMQSAVEGAACLMVASRTDLAL
jgi:hypothetical protein